MPYVWDSRLQKLVWKDSDRWRGPDGTTYEGSPPEDWTVTDSGTGQSTYDRWGHAQAQGDSWYEDVPASEFYATETPFGGEIQYSPPPPPPPAPAEPVYSNWQEDPSLRTPAINNYWTYINGRFEQAKAQDHFVWDRAGRKHKASVYWKERIDSFDPRRSVNVQERNKKAIQAWRQRLEAYKASLIENDPVLRKYKEEEEKIQSGDHEEKDKKRWVKELHEKYIKRRSELIKLANKKIPPPRLETLDGVMVNRHRPAGEDPDDYASRLHAEAQEVEAKSAQQNRTNNVKAQVTGNAEIRKLFQDAISKGVRSFEALQSSSYYKPRLDALVNAWLSKTGEPFSAQHLQFLKEQFQALTNEDYYQQGQEEYEATHAQDPSLDTPEQAEARAAAKQTPYGIIAESKKDHESKVAAGKRSRHGKTFDPQDALVNEWGDEHAFHEPVTFTGSDGEQHTTTEYAILNYDFTQNVQSQTRKTKDDWINFHLDRLTKKYSDQRGLPPSQAWIKRRRKDLEDMWELNNSLVVSEGDTMRVDDRLGLKAPRTGYQHTFLPWDADRIDRNLAYIASPDLGGTEEQQKEIDRRVAQKESENNTAREAWEHTEKRYERVAREIEKRFGKEAANAWRAGIKWDGNQFTKGAGAYHSRMTVAEMRPVVMAQYVDQAIESGQLKLTPKQLRWWSSYKTNNKLNATWMAWASPDPFEGVTWQEAIGKIVPRDHPLYDRIWNIPDEEVADFVDTMSKGQYYKKYGVMHKYGVTRFLADSAGAVGLDWASLGSAVPDVMGLTRGGLGRWIRIYDDMYQKSAHEAREKWIAAGKNEADKKHRRLMIMNEQSLGMVGHVLGHIMGPNVARWLKGSQAATYVPANALTKLKLLPFGSNFSLQTFLNIAGPIALATNRSAGNVYQEAKEFGASDSTAAWMASNEMAAEVVTEVVGAALGVNWIKNMIRGYKIPKKITINTLLQNTTLPAFKRFAKQFAGNQLEEAVAEYWSRRNVAGLMGGVPLDPNATSWESLKEGAIRVTMTNFWFSLLGMAQGWIGSKNLIKNWKNEIGDLQKMAVIDPEFQTLVGMELQDGRRIINYHLKVEFQKYMDENPNANHAKVFAMLFPLFAEIIASPNAAATRALFTEFGFGQPHNYRTSEQRRKIKADVEAEVNAANKKDVEIENLISYSLESIQSTQFTVEVTDQQGQPQRVTVHAPTEQDAVDTVSKLTDKDGKPAFNLPEANPADPIAQTPSTQQQIDFHNQSRPYVVDVYNDETGQTVQHQVFARNETEAANMATVQGDGTRVESVRVAEPEEVDVIGYDQEQDVQNQEEEIDFQPIEEEPVAPVEDSQVESTPAVDPELSEGDIDLGESVEEEDDFVAELPDIDPGESQPSETGETTFTSPEGAVAEAAEAAQEESVPEEVIEESAPFQPDAREWTEETRVQKEQEALTQMRQRFGPQVQITPAATAEQARVYELGKSLGLHVVYYDGLPEDVQGAAAQAGFRMTGVLGLNKSRSGEFLWEVMGHEVTHGTTLDRMAPLLRLSQDEVERLWEKSLEGLTPEQRMGYEAQAQRDPSMMQREAVARYVQGVFTNPQFRKELVANEPGVVRKILNMFNVFKPKMNTKERNVINAIRLLMNKTYGPSKRPRSYNEVYDDLSSKSDAELGKLIEKYGLAIKGLSRERIISELAQEVLTEELLKFTANTNEEADRKTQKAAEKIPTDQKQSLLDQSEQGAESVIDQLKNDGLILMVGDPTPTEAAPQEGTQEWYDSLEKETQDLSPEESAQLWDEILPGDEVVPMLGYEPTKSHVQQSDLIDMPSLLAQIEREGGKVWLWYADQSGTGTVTLPNTGETVELDGGPSYALNPENRQAGRVWASSAPAKQLSKMVGKSDYIFIVSYAPETNLLFNKKVFDALINNAFKDKNGNLLNYASFKSSIARTAGKDSVLYKDYVSKYNSWEEIKESPDRKGFLQKLTEQNGKNTKLNKYLSNRKFFTLTPNELRDDFYRENNFKLNEIMLVLKGGEVKEGEARHSTYGNALYGEVVGIPNRKVDAFTILREEDRKGKPLDLSAPRAVQLISPYGMLGVKEVTKISKTNEAVRAAAKLRQIVEENPDGFTADTSGEFATGGYIVAPDKSTETEIDPANMTDETLAAFFWKHTDKLEVPGAMLGGWFNTKKGVYVLDVVFAEDNLQDAIDIAIWADQDAIFHLDTFTEIETKDGKGQAAAPKQSTSTLQEILGRRPSQRLNEYASQRRREQRRVRTPSAQGVRGESQNVEGSETVFMIESSGPSNEGVRKLMAAAKDLANYVMLRVKAGESLEEAVENVLEKAGFTTTLPPDAGLADKERQAATFKLRRMLMAEASAIHQSLGALEDESVLPFSIQYAATNKMMDLLRAQLDLSPAGAPSSLQLQRMAKKAIGELEAVEGYVDAVVELAKIIIQNPRPLNPDEQVGFFFTLNYLADQMRMKAKQLRAAEADATTRPQVKEKLAAQVAELRSALDSTSEANKVAGTYWSISGRVRGALGRQYLNIGYDVESLLTEARARKTKELTPAEIGFIKRLAKQHEAIEKTLLQKETPIKEKYASDAIRSKNRNKTPNKTRIDELREKLVNLKKELNC